MGSLLFPEEVPALRALDEAFGPMLDDLGDSPDEVYLADPRWASVVSAAHAALLVMRASGRTEPPGPSTTRSPEDR